jgi:holin-like protein
MKYIRQFSIILTVSFAGEVLHALLPLPIPASIYGLVLMLAALCFHVIPLEAVRECGRFLVEIMPLMFIPAAVGLTAAWDRIRPILVPLLVITVVTTVLVMTVAGRTTQWVIRRDAASEKKHNHAKGKV